MRRGAVAVLILLAIRRVCVKLIEGNKDIRAPFVDEIEITTDGGNS